MSRRVRPSRRRTAHHEAGHAVIGRVMGQSCGACSIVQAGNSFGHSVCADPWKTVADWDERGRWRSYESIMRGRILAFMAGAEAEIEFFGACGGGDSTRCTEMPPAI